jgi:hypothetical protein
VKRAWVLQEPGGPWLRGQDRVDHLVGGFWRLTAAYQAQGANAKIEFSSGHVAFRLWADGVGFEPTTSVITHSGFKTGD